MDPYGWLQIAIFVGLIVAATKPMGIYLSRILDPDAQTFLSPLISPVERLFYRLFGLKRREEQGWRAYLFSLLVFSCLSMIFSYLIMRLQHLLPLNPQGFVRRSGGATEFLVAAHSHFAAANQSIPE